MTELVRGANERMEGVNAFGASGRVRVNLRTVAITVEKEWKNIIGNYKNIQIILIHIMYVLIRIFIYTLLIANIYLQ